MKIDEHPHPHAVDTIHNAFASIPLPIPPSSKQSLPIVSRDRELDISHGGQRPSSNGITNVSYHMPRSGVQRAM